jgi:hypothetical protein
MFYSGPALRAGGPHFDPGADAQVANLLPFGRLARSTGPRCPNRLFDLRHYLYDNPENRLYNDIISPCVGRRVGLYPIRTSVKRHIRQLLFLTTSRKNGLDSSNAENNGCVVDLFPFCPCSICLRHPDPVTPNHEQSPRGMSRGLHPRGSRNR